MCQGRCGQEGTFPANIGESMAPRTRRTSSATPRSDAPSEPSLGTTIQQERLRRGGIGVDQAARKAGISPSAWRKIESGKVPSPRPETLIKMATGIGADPNLFLGVAGLPAVVNEAATIAFAQPIGAVDHEYRLSTLERALHQLDARQRTTEGELSELRVDLKGELGEIRQLMSELVAAGASSPGAPSGSAGAHGGSDPGVPSGRRPRSR